MSPRTRSSAVTELASHLGDPTDDAMAFSHRRCAELDRAEEFPEEIVESLNQWGLQRYYVPVRFGGWLDDHTVPWQLIRAVARRDVTVAVAHGKTFLGGVSAWMCDPTPASRRLAGRIIDGVPVSWGLTERGHGSDLLAGEVSATPAPEGGYLISGEKWLINNASRGHALIVLARSRPGGGPRGFDVYIVDKDQIGSTAFRVLPKVRTHGIRGADISGIALDHARVPADARLGQAGSGLETVLKALQLTRTLCGALSLGAGDQALELAMSFAGQRKLYGRRLAELRQAQATLTDANADHLLAEAVAITGARSIHHLSAELSLTAPVVKYLVPTRTDHMITTLGRFMGARSLLVDGFEHGRFQKVARDHRIVSIFDGNALVNLNAIVNEFATIARHAGTSPDTSVLGELFDLTADVPEFDPMALSLLSRRGSSVFAALPALAAELRREYGAAPVTGLAHEIVAAQRELMARLSILIPTTPVPTASFELAQRFALCWAASAAMGVFLRNRHRVGPSHAVLWHNALWLEAALSRMHDALGRGHRRDGTRDAALWRAVTELASSGQPITLLPHPLASGTSP